MAIVCTTCGWDRVAPAAAACGRCGAAAARGRGLAGASFAAGMSSSIEAAFAAANIEPDAGAGVRPIGWSGYGSTIALLGDAGRKLTLEHFRLAGGDGPSAAIARYRRIELSAALLDALVAPPLACRLGSCLVTTSEIRLFVMDEPHLPQSGGEIAWSAAEAGERICAAAMTADGDVFVAAAPAGDADLLTVRAADGSAVASIAGLSIKAGEGVGFAVRRAGPGASAPVVAWAWSGGRLFRQPEGADPAAAAITALNGLDAPALSWMERVRSESPFPWHDWRCAASGVYPIEMGGAGGSELAGLALIDEGPELVRYGRGRHHSVVADSAERYLVVEAGGLRVVDPRTGHLLAHRDESVEGQAVFSGTGEGRFFALRSEGSTGVAMRGISVRGGELVDGFRALLRRGGRSAGEQPLRAVPGLPPIETDEGLLICLEEGAGSDARVRLWHGTSLLRAGAAA